MAEKDAGPRRALLHLYTDGASNGNPGPSASAWIIVDPASHEMLVERGEFIGHGTNNEAEYAAVIRGLRDCLALRAEEVEVFSDSQVCMHQMNGQYRVKEPRLKARYDEVVVLAARLKHVKFTWVPRGNEWIARCDRLAEETIDR